MDIFGFKTVESFPGLYHPELDMIIISDPHLGIEGSMTSRGSYVPEFQLDEMVEELERVKKDTGASRILINGDLKNEFRTRYAERDEIKEFIEFLEEEFDEIILIEGNHDTMVESTVKETGHELVERHLEGGILFTHGHRSMDSLTEEFETIVLGHEHPALALEDEIGVKEKLACFLYGKNRNGKKMIVMPAYSMVSNGTSVNEVPESELLSPLLSNMIDKDEMRAVGVSREAGLMKFPEIGKF